MNEEQLKKQNVYLDINKTETVPAENTFIETNKQDNFININKTESEAELSKKQREIEIQRATQMLVNARAAEVKLPPVDINDKPVQAEMPERSRKQQRQHEKTMAKAHTFGAEQYLKRKTTVTPEIRALMQEQGKNYDLNFIEAMYEFKVDKNGDPITPEDRDAQAQARALMKKYIGGSKESHNAVLDLMTEKFLSIKVDPHCFDDPDKTMENYRELKIKADLMMGFVDARHNNPEYFQALDQKTKDAIEKQDRLFGDGNFTQTLNNIAVMNKMSADTGREIDDDNLPEQCRLSYLESRGDYKEACCKQKMEPMVNEIRAAAQENMKKALKNRLKSDTELSKGNRQSFTILGVASSITSVWLSTDEPEYTALADSLMKLKTAAEASRSVAIEQTSYEKTMERLRQEINAGTDTDGQAALALESATRKYNILSKELDKCTETEKELQKQYQELSQKSSAEAREIKRKARLARQK